MSAKKVPRPPSPVHPHSPAVIGVHARLFREDVDTIKRYAAEDGLPWQVALRVLVRKALRADPRSKILGEKP